MVVPLVPMNDRLATMADCPPPEPVSSRRAITITATAIPRSTNAGYCVNANGNADPAHCWFSRMIGYPGSSDFLVVCALVWEGSSFDGYNPGVKEATSSPRAVAFDCRGATGLSRGPRGPSRGWDSRQERQDACDGREFGHGFHRQHPPQCGPKLAGTRSRQSSVVRWNRMRPHPSGMESRPGVCSPGSTGWQMTRANVVD